MTESSSTPQKHSQKTLLWSLLLVGAATALLILAQSLLRKPSSEISYSGGFIAEKGAISPDFDLHEFKGKSVKLSSVQNKLSLINFWATWCTSCVIEIPSIIKLHQEFKSQGFNVFFVSVDEEPEAVLPEKIEELKMNFSTYIDKNQNLSELFEVSAIPLTVILNSKREIVYIEPGERDWYSEEVRAQIKKWLTE